MNRYVVSHAARRRKVVRDQCGDVEFIARSSEVWRLRLDYEVTLRDHLLLGDTYRLIGDGNREHTEGTVEVVRHRQIHGPWFTVGVDDAGPEGYGLLTLALERIIRMSAQRLLVTARRGCLIENV